MDIRHFSSLISIRFTLAIIGVVAGYLFSGVALDSIGSFFAASLVVLLALVYSAQLVNFFGRARNFLCESRAFRPSSPGILSCQFWHTLFLKLDRWRDVWI